MCKTLRIATIISRDMPDNGDSDASAYTHAVMCHRVDLATYSLYDIWHAMHIMQKSDRQDAISAKSAATRRARREAKTGGRAQ